MRFLHLFAPDALPPPPLSPHVVPPIPTSPLTLLGVEAIYRRPLSKGKRFLLDSRCPFLTFSQPFFILLSSCRRRATLEPPSVTLKSPLVPSPPPPFSSPTSTCRVRARSRDHVRCSTFRASLLLTIASTLAFAIVADVEGPSSVLFSTLFSLWKEG